jgi:Tfp pilus assembly protein PilV
MNNKKNSKSKFFKGFSFIEVMFSVFLISVGITAAISLITLGIKKSTENRRQLIAVMLSQEGIELARNIRDTDAKATPPDSFKHMQAGKHEYIIDYNDSPWRLETTTAAMKN